MVVGQANLLTHHNYSSEAEQAYRLASEICPFNPEAAYGLASLLGGTGRSEEARQIVEDFARKYPEQAEAGNPSIFLWQANPPGR